MSTVQRDRVSHRRVVGAGAVTAASGLLVLLALTVPGTLAELSLAAFLRLPLEAVVYVAVVLALPRDRHRLRTVLALCGGGVLALSAVSRLLDLGFGEALNRPFDPLIDWRYAGSLVSLVRDSFGERLGSALLLAALLTALLLVVLLPLSLLRVTRAAVRHPTAASWALTATAALWLGLAVLDVRGSAGAVAARDTAPYVAHQVSRIPAALRDQQEFSAAAEDDPLRGVPPEQLLTGLRGKDVVFVFVESYGRVAVEGSWFSPSVAAVLTEGTEQLDRAGFSSRSAWMTSPTFGAISWLAHATFQSGLWVESQQRYDALVTSRRLTLSRLFGAAGWRTVAVIPANDRDWPQGAFYGFDHVYDSRNVGYQGPRFGYPTMPDQYTLDAFHRLELAPEHRRPVMAEVDLITSHAPWSRTPRLVDQARVGDGAVFDGMPEELASERDIWPSPRRVQEAYGASIEYSLQALLTFLTTYGDDDTVLVFLGDHQPAPIVAGEGADHDVPVSIVARDPEVLERVSDWGWDEGLRPGAGAPLWRMDEFRDRFLAAYGSSDHTEAQAARSP